jgi:hypothetical protein
MVSVKETLYQVHWINLNTDGRSFYTLMAKDDPLSSKYLKALSLISEGQLSYREIAIACKINVDEFYGLIEGTNTSSPQVQEKFSEAFDSINKQIDRDIRKLSKTCRKKTLYLIDSYLSKHKQVGKKDTSTVKTLTSIANGLGKVTPNVEIGSFSYTKGLSPEDIYAEFKRLSGLASDRGTVQAASERGSGEVPVSFRPGSATEEVEEDTLLSAEPEA